MAGESGAIVLLMGARVCLASLESLDAGKALKCDLEHVAMSVMEGDR